MSDSRLEKFIYAICSMDVSDLPVPLSRIETLWNCLITGETPDFEPLSRNEKYLMAMLDRYDISNLPAPMSRGEKLLYKIAVGETDLSDVPGYLSRYEELLKYLIENGGISGGDFEYVLYTLNQPLSTLYSTAKKPVKSAILKGQTLVNLNTNESHSKTLTPEINNDRFYNLNIPYVIPANTDFTIKGKCDNQSTSNIVLEIKYSDDTYSYLEVKGVGESGIINKLYNRGKDVNSLRIYIQNGSTGTATVSDIICVIGNVVSQNIPYFEGMQSVKMPVLKATGKNLFDGKLEYGIINGNNGLLYDSNDYVRIQDFIPINYEEITYTVINEQCGLSFYFYDKDKKFISSKAMPRANGNLSIPEGGAYLKFRTYPLSDESVTTNLNTQVQLEVGSIATEYEPYKSNILTVNEDVTLRSNGDVYDELDLLTGKLTQRIDEDGSVLTQEVVKTVDLTVVDQDNQPTQLGTFENITHVSLEAENLIPEVEMEVATRISEELASASPLMDDISTKQEQLNTTVDEQSDNVDATMIATTEIFEETL